MGPKVSAAIEFNEATGKPAAIGKLDDAVEIVRGERGTWFEPALGYDHPERRAAALANDSDKARLDQLVDATVCAPVFSK